MRKCYIFLLHSFVLGRIFLLEGHLGTVEFNYSLTFIFQSLTFEGRQIFSLPTQIDRCWCTFF